MSSDENHMTPDFEADFSKFMDEIGSMSESGIKRPIRLQTSNGMIVNLGDASIQIKRLRLKEFSNWFEVLLLPPDASDEDIKRQYRKLSQMCHPDRCKIDGAIEAFQLINKANSELQKPENRLKFVAVIDQARRNVVRKQKDDEANRKRLGKPPLPQKSDSDMLTEITDECNRLIEEINKSHEYATNVREANEKREQKMEEDFRRQAEKEKAEKRKREDTMHERTSGWAQFQNAQKRQKTFGEALNKDI